MKSLKTKRINKCVLAVFTLVLSFSGVAHAKGQEGGGGWGFELTDDSVILGDPWVKAPGEIYVLSPQLKQGVRETARLLDRYLTRANWHVRDKVGAFVEKEIMGKNVEYRLVPEADMPDDEICRKVSFKGRPANAVRLLQLGCTVGRVTWLNQDALPSMTFIELLKLIFHERLHSTPVLREYHILVREEKIAHITNGIELLRKKLADQVKGDRSSLSDSDYAKLVRMQLELSSIFDEGEPETPYYRIHKNGGGLLVAENFDPNYYKVPDAAFVGIGTILPSKFQYYGNVTTTISLHETSAIVGSVECCETYSAVSLEKGALAQNVNLQSEHERLVIGEDSKVIDVLGRLKNVIVGAAASLEGLRVGGYMHFVKLGKGASLIGTDLRAYDSVASLPALGVNDGVSVTNFHAVLQSKSPGKDFLSGPGWPVGLVVGLASMPVAVVEMGLGSDKPLMFKLIDEKIAILELTKSGDFQSMDPCGNDLKTPDVRGQKRPPFQKVLNVKGVTLLADRTAFSTLCKKPSKTYIRTDNL